MEDEAVYIISHTDKLNNTESEPIESAQTTESLDYTIVQRSFLQDVYRIENSVLLYVTKFIETGGYVFEFHDSLNKVKFKKLENKCYELKSDITTKWEGTFKKGTLIYDFTPIKLVDKSQYIFKLKISGQLSGSISDFSDKLDLIKIIVDTYK